MRIGIDIDGVLTDEHTFIIDFASKYLNERNIPYTVHKDIYDSEKVFDDIRYIYMCINSIFDKVKLDENDY